MDETLEANILKQLSGIRDSVGKACLQELHSTNGPLIMALSGSKGKQIIIYNFCLCMPFITSGVSYLICPPHIPTHNHYLHHMYPYLP